ncbi:receptor-like protein EIX1 [Cornus florida]|uniref:receptor-like protein EIX1 n=1 Tax=Cornus florida TaxID=4283 RepID=UPI00289C115A|nr:receptor-like protein EIX1 [Cornus florida]XP_059667158.1 receptor-like protein EIX1 [Cornus florida]
MDSVDLSMSVDWLQEINMLPYLIDLSLESCGLRDANLPLPSYFNLSRSLLSLNLSSNTLSPSIFSWLPNISTNLLVLQLRSCDMRGPKPDAFWNMTSLLHFDLSSNLFEGGIPKSIGNLCSLQRLDLTFNSLTQPLTDLTQNLFANCSADTLEFLNLGYNRFGGPLPDFTRFLFLNELNFNYNQLNGSSYGHPPNRHLPNLLILSLEGNRLNGNLIDSIGHLPNLEFLDVSSNKFEGVVSDLSIFSKLQYLDLSFNYLAMNLSSNWVPPFQLKTIILSSCKLGPQFPNWLQWQKKVSWLDISDNEISDFIPS